MFFTDLGLSQTFIREVAKPHVDLASLFSELFFSRVLLCLVTSLLSIPFVLFLYSNNSNMQYAAFWIIIPSIFGVAFQGIGIVYFQVRETMIYSALIQTVSGIMTAVFLFICIFMNWGINIVAPFYGISFLIGGVFSLWLVFRKIQLKLKYQLPEALLRDLLSFSIGGGLLMVLPQMGSLVMERVTELKQVGLFSAAYRIPSFLYYIPGVVAAAFYPLLFKFGNANLKEEHFKLSVNQIRIMHSFGVVMCLPFLFYPQWWIEFLFGPQWLEASVTLSILSLMVILQSVSFPLADALTTKGMQRKRAIILFLSLVIGITLYTILGAKLGSLGGAYAALGVELTMLAGLIAFNPQGLRLFWKGTSRNWINLLIVIGVHMLISGMIYPIIGMVLDVLMYTFMFLVLNKESKEFVFQLLSKRRKV
ncbi:O-antigen/teichoic acid export membrane protein [Paenibacillus methanolicus]|uniref:O-antigen/teichoic acid export membrane protein n=1 Tax=Paenibacillus methanolicus TaxID=582686 RepID=A0A5S5C927_9BACL|nr:O-antigen/teichoic acid export membrane protein [Paenibacillus methanolicus]